MTQIACTGSGGTPTSPTNFTGIYGQSSSGGSGGLSDQQISVRPGSAVRATKLVVGGQNHQDFHMGSFARSLTGGKRGYAPRLEDGGQKSLSTLVRAPQAALRICAPICGRSGGRPSSIHFQI